MEQAIHSGLPSLAFEVGINGSSQIESTIEPVSVVVMVIVAVL